MNKINQQAVKKSNEFMRERRKYALGDLTTERIKPLNLSGEVKKKHGTERAVGLLIKEEKSVYKAARIALKSGDYDCLVREFKEVLELGGRIVFLGAGAKLREAIFMEREWKHMVKNLPAPVRQKLPPGIADFVMSMGAGGDLAQIRTAEGMEDVGLVADLEIERVFANYRRQGVRGPIMIVGHDSSGNSLYTVRAAQKCAELGGRAVYMINNPAHEARRVARIRKILDDKRIISIHLATDPPPVAGSTRLQPTTAGMVLLAPALMRAFSLAFGLGLLRFDILAALERWVRKLERASIDLARFIDLKSEIYRNNPVFGGQGRKRGYLTFLVGRRAMLPVITNEVEEYPTFGTPPYASRQELKNGAPLSPSGILTDAANPRQALNVLFGREPRDLNLSKLMGESMLRRIYRRRENIPDLSRRRLEGFCFDRRSVSRQRPLGRGNMAAVVLMGHDVAEFNRRGSRLRQTLLQARRNGAATAIIAVSHLKLVKAPAVDSLVTVWMPDDPMSIRQSVVLKMLLNIQSNAAMAKLNKLCGNLMLDVSPSNGKLVDRATRYILHTLRSLARRNISYRRANQYFFEAADYAAKARRRRQIPSSPVKLAIIRSLSDLSPQRSDNLIKQYNGDIEGFIRHLTSDT